MSEKALPNSIAGLSKTDEQIAADLKARFDASLTPMLRIMDEALAMGFALRWTAIVPTPPDGRHRMVELVAIRQKVY